MKGREIVQVEGGHTIRSTGRKDRHSKIFTAKGPRDRRVRLSAQTAIQFYDVQDRLGYDRPSKALDWLIHKAKNAINQLNELPPWNPSTDNAAVAPSSDSNPEKICNNNNNNNPSTSTFSFMQPTNSVHFPDFSSEGIIHRDLFQAEDLGLSLQSLQADQNNLVGFQESFQRPYNWNSVNGNMGPISQQGFSFSQRELLQSNLLVQAWNERPFAVVAGGNDYPPGRGRQYSDSGGHIDLGTFHVPAQFYAEDGEGMNR